jgi:hypothetical protein
MADPASAVVGAGGMVRVRQRGEHNEQDEIIPWTA